MWVGYHDGRVGFPKRSSRFREMISVIIEAQATINPAALSGLAGVETLPVDEKGYLTAGRALLCMQCEEHRTVDNLSHSFLTVALQCTPSVGDSCPSGFSS